MNFNNRLYKDHPLHLYSHEVVDNKLNLTIININKKRVSTIFVEFNDAQITFEVDTNDEVIELSNEYFNKNQLGTPIIKWAIIEDEKIDFYYEKDYLYIITPKSIASMKDEKYLYINKMVKYNGCQKQNVICQADQFKDYWHCSCGTVNLNSQDKCLKCGIEKEKLFSTEIDNSIEEVETKKIVKSNSYILAWFAIIALIQFIVVDIMCYANIVFETKLASSVYGVILRFGVLTSIIALSIGIIIARKRYLTNLVKIFEISRFLILLLINIIFTMAVLKHSYIFFLFLGLDLVFIPFYIYNHINIKRNWFKIIASSLLFISLIGGTTQELIYSQYSLTVEKEGLTLVLETEEEKYVVPNEINNISVTCLKMDFDYDYSNLKELYINKDLKKIIVSNSRLLPSLEKIIVDEENSTFYIDQGILFSKTTNDVALIPAASTTEINVNWNKVSAHSISECPNLRKVYISKNVESIDLMVFANNENLEEIIIEEGSKLSYIGDNVFLNCSSLKEIELPKSLNYIGYSIFSGCSSLEKVTTPFLGKERYYTHETTNTDVAAYLFGPGYNFDQIDNVNVKEIYVTDQAIYDNVTFYNCKAEKIVLNHEPLLNDESLGKNAFYNCINLKTFTVPEGITSILENCFMNCENLEEIILPSSLKTVETNAFSNCKSLKKVIYLGENFEKIDIKDGNSALKSAFFNFM